MSFRESLVREASIALAGLPLPTALSMNSGDGLVGIGVDGIGVDDGRRRGRRDQVEKSRSALDLTEVGCQGAAATGAEEEEEAGEKSGAAGENGSVVTAVPPAEAPSQKAPFFGAFAMADRNDILLLTLGSLMFIGAGTLNPIMAIEWSSGISDAGLGDFDGLIGATKKIAFIGLAAFLSMLIATLCYEIAGERQIARIKREYVASALRLNVGAYDMLDVGTLASDVEMSCVQIRQGVGNKCGEMLKSLSLFVTGFIIGFVHNWRLTLIMSVSVPVVGGILAVVFKRIGKASERAKDLYTHAGSVAEEALTSVRTVAAFGLEPMFGKRFDEEIDSSVKEEVKGAYAKGFGFGSLMFSIFVVCGLGWLYGGHVIKLAVLDRGPAGMADGQKVIIAFFCVLNSAFSLGILGPSLTALASGGTAMTSVKRIINMKSTIDPLDPSGATDSPLSPAGAPDPTIEGKIEFDHVRFAYPSRPERDIYMDVSFVIEPGEMVALVGPSGCGKSTVIQLVERFYDVSGGALKIDGRPVAEYNLKWLRNQMALVSQEPRLFCTTIEANILQGKPDATHEQVVEAAKSANAHDFIMSLANGYQTEVGIGGGLLSGGQKQRVAIARAILRDPKILILDEATSALDNKSERVVQEALDKLLESKKRTTIVIAHRLTTIRSAHKIIVIDNAQGKGSIVIEQGSHHELMAREGGVYRSLVDAQSMGPPGEEEEEENPALTTAPIILNEATLRKQLSKKPSKKLSMRGGRKSTAVLAEGGQVESDKSKGRSKLATAKSPTRKLWASMLRYSWKSFTGIIVFGACNGAMQPLNGLLVASFITTFFTWDTSKTTADNADHIWHKSIILSCTYIAIGFGLMFSQFGEAWCSDWNSASTVSRLRKKTFENMLYQDMEFFDNPVYNSGFLSSVLSADCESAKTLTGVNFALTYRVIITIVIALGIGFSASWAITCVVGGMWLVVLPLYAFQVQMTKGTSIKVGSVDDVSSPAFVFFELVANLRTVAAYNLQPQVQTAYNEAVQHYLNIGLRNSSITALGVAVSECMMYFTSASAYRFGAAMLEKNKVNFANMSRATMSIMFAGNGASRAAAFSADAKKAQIAVSNVYTVLEREPKMDARTDLGRSAENIDQEDVGVKHVRFRYPGRPTVAVLRDVDFSIPHGKTVAMVGESGSGKSTIIQFIERFYDVGASDYFAEVIDHHNRTVAAAGEGVTLQRALSMFKGNITVGSADIQDINLRSLREQIGLVGQEPALFDLSVRENIRYGKLSATEAEIEEAAKLANAHEFISKLPEGYDTRVGKGGSLLSGGQKQRVAIARALVRNPKILLLDEATSALDPESEKIVQKALDDLLKGSKRTTVVIAHRLSTIRNADLIVVFRPEPGEGSTIVETGTHDALMRIPNGIYAGLVHIAEQAGAA